MGKNTRKHLVWGIAAAVLIIGGYYLFTHKPTLSGEQGPGGRGRGGMQTVGVAKVAPGNVQVTLSALGTMTPASTVTVHSRVDGQLMKLGFTDGQMVNQGDVLAELDARPYQAQLKQAQGQLLRDQALLANAQIDLQRFESLLAQDSIAKQQVDAQRALVKQYQGAVQTDQGQVDNAKLQITYSKVQAPISGRAGIRQVDVGNIVHAGDADGIVVLTQVQPIDARFAVPESDLAAVLQQFNTGQPLTVEAWDRDNTRLLATGTLAAVDNRVDTATGTVMLKATFANADNSLYANQFVNVRLILQQLNNVLLVPGSAVQRGTQGSYVYVVQGDTVHQRAVTTGPGQDQNLSIASGLTSGETVVTDGTDRLKDGAKVRVAGVSSTMAGVSGTQAVSGTTGRHHRGGADAAQPE